MLRLLVDHLVELAAQSMHHLLAHGRVDLDKVERVAGHLVTAHPLRVLDLAVDAVDDPHHFPPVRVERLAVQRGLDRVAALASAADGGRCRIGRSGGRPSPR